MEAQDFSCRAVLSGFSFLVTPVWAQAHPDRIQILMAVVRYKTWLSKPRRGLCSTWLASLNPEQGNCLDSMRIFMCLHSTQCSSHGTVVELCGAGHVVEHHHHTQLEHAGLTGWAELPLTALPCCSRPLQSLACSSSLP